MVECDLAKVEVAGSNPVSRSRFLMIDNKLHHLASRFEIEHPEFKTIGYALLACFSALENPDSAQFEILGKAVIAR